MRIPPLCLVVHAAHCWALSCAHRIIVVGPIIGARVSTRIGHRAHGLRAHSAREHSTILRRQGSSGPKRIHTRTIRSHTGKTRESNMYNNQCDGSRLAQGGLTRKVKRNQLQRRWLPPTSPTARGMALPYLGRLRPRAWKRAPTPPLAERP